MKVWWHHPDAVRAGGLTNRPAKVQLMVTNSTESQLVRQGDEYRFNQLKIVKAYGQVIHTNYGKDIVNLCQDMFMGITKENPSD